MPRPSAEARPAPAAKKQVPRRHGPVPADTAQRIVESITAAIVDRRLTPGTRLAEQQIADVFGVSRTIVRQALHQLSRDRLVTLEKARGARVAEPGVEEARQVLEVRQLIECALVRRAASGLGPDQLVRLRAHLAEVRAALRRHDVPEGARLLSRFPVLLAGTLGNGVLADLLGHLVSRSALSAALPGDDPAASLACARQAAVVDALERRDARAAARLMSALLRQVEHNLQVVPRGPQRRTLLQPETLRP